MNSTPVSKLTPVYESVVTTKLDRQTEGRIDRRMERWTDIHRLTLCLVRSSGYGNKP